MAAVLVGSDFTGEGLKMPDMPGKGHGVRVV